jgi:iron-sulfur cluster assembly protein/iron-sulfur cluster insertion protein
MIKLSSRAAAQIRVMRGAAPAGPRHLRVAVETGGCSGQQYAMAFDEPKPGDLELESEGVALVVDPASFALLDGMSIDFDDGLHGKGFEITNPNAHSTCGCGKSFN